MRARTSRLNDRCLVMSCSSRQRQAPGLTLTGPRWKGRTTDVPGAGAPFAPAVPVAWAPGGGFGDGTSPCVDGSAHYGAPMLTTGSRFVVTHAGSLPRPEHLA